MAKYANNFHLTPMLCFKTVSNPSYCDDKLAIIAKLAAKELDMGVKRSVVAVKIISPDVGNEFLSFKGDILV